MQATCRLRSLFKTLTSYSSQLQILRPFSSPAVASRRDWGFYADDNDDCKESAVYKHVLKFQRPSTIGWENELHNTVRFIGTVDFPPKIMNSSKDRFGIHTILKVNCSSDSKSNSWFRILLCMWDEIAEVSIKHLKPNDYIYVAGRLESYRKADENGQLRMKYSVLVNDINYIAQHGKASTRVKADQFEPKDSKVSALDKRRNRFHLWQVFFANPFEWWDNRKSKLNSRSPDFKHKSTGEALWLDPYSDPPWIRKQLQLQDSRMAQNGSAAECRNSASNVSALVYDDL